MIPRGTLDIRWRDLFAGLWYGWVPTDPKQAQTAVEMLWSPDQDALVCLSVRSGLDLLLQELAWPAGSEILVSAVTIPDMVQILVHHGLVPVPVDIDPDTLSIDLAQLQERVGPQTKAILVAHLFGSRMPLDDLMQLAQQHSLWVIEDCAQAYDGSSYRGHAETDVSLFSFGPIKMQTALGGALLRVRDRALLSQLRQRQAQYPRQSRKRFMGRVGRFMALKALSHPGLFSGFVICCRWLQVEHDTILKQAVRGFPGTELISRLRHQPAVPLLRLLHRRLRHADPQRIRARAIAISRLLGQFPTLQAPGQKAAHHVHWVLPIVSSHPEALVRLLWAEGFDATRKASSLFVVPPASEQTDRTTPQAQQMLDHLVYLPVSPRLRDRQMQRLGGIITDFESQQMTKAN